MSNEKYKKSVVYQQVLTNLAADGVNCDYNTRYYDEKGTSDGGTGFRAVFKNINDTIIEKHAILRLLSGEERADITEDIPVIDYYNQDNTGFSYHYPELKEGNSTRDFSSIYPLKENDHTIDLIKAKDPYFINRALAGQGQIEHFFNSKVDAGNVRNVLVSDVDETKRVLTYRGSKSCISYDLDNNTQTQSDGSSTEKMVCGCVPGSEFFTDGESFSIDNFYLAVSLVDPKQFTLGDKIALLVDGTTLGDKKYYLDTFVTTEKDLSETTPLDKIIYKPDSKKSKAWNSWKLLLGKGNSISFDSEENPLEKYFNNHTESDRLKIFLEPSDRVIQLISDGVTEHSKLIILRKVERDNVNSPYIAYGLLIHNRESVLSGAFEAFDKEFENKSTDKDIDILNEYFFNDELDKKFTNTFLNLNIKSVAKEDGSETKETLDSYHLLSSLINFKTEYVAPCSGILLGKFCEPYNRSEQDLAGTKYTTVNQWKFHNDSELYRKYYSTTAGYNIGTIFTNKNLFGRGEFKESPFKLTPNMIKDLTDPNTFNGEAITDDTTGRTFVKVYQDGKERIINGFTTYLYHKIENYIQPFSILKDYFTDVDYEPVDNIPNPWYSTNQRYDNVFKTLDQVATCDTLCLKNMDDITVTGGLNIKPIHINKFKALDRDITYDDMDVLMNSWFGDTTLGVKRFTPYNSEESDEDTYFTDNGYYVLNFDAREDKSKDTYVESGEGNRNWIVVIPITNRTDEDFKYSEDTSQYYSNLLVGMQKDFFKVWQATYTRLYHKFLFIPAGVEPFNRLRVNCISPFEFFLSIHTGDNTVKSTSDVKTILVSPSKADTLASKMYLISKEELSLQENHLCSFWSKINGTDKLLSMKVSKKYSFLPSKICRVHIKDSNADANEATVVTTSVTFYDDGSKYVYYHEDEDSNGLGSIEHMKDKDCFVYVLEHPNLSLDNFGYYDTSDTYVDTNSEELSKYQLTPFAYPIDNFKVASITSDFKKKLSNENDIYNLRNTTILDNIPIKLKEEVNEAGEVKKVNNTTREFYENNFKIGANSSNLSVFADILLNKEDDTSILGALSKSVSLQLLTDIINNCDMTKEDN